MHYCRLRAHGSPGGAARLIGEPGEGSIDPNGYRVLYLPDHQLARAQGKVMEHRVVLFDAIGPGTHSCYWCGVPVSWERASGTKTLVADHLDGRRLNNRRQNLVPSCIPCNSRREVAAS